MRVGAFFDIDGTVVRGDTQKIFALHMIQRGRVSRAVLLNLTWWYILYRLHKVDKEFIREKAMHVSKGEDHHEVVAEFEDCYHNIFKHRIFPNIKRRIELHQERGHSVVLVSAAYEPFVEVVSRGLKCEGAYGTRMILDNDKFTGEVDGEVNIGEAKVKAVRHAAKKLNIDLSRSYAYGDHYLDRFMMKEVAHPICVNPEGKLRGLAKEKDWKIVWV